jgi:hypothetical protein
MPQLLQPVQYATLSADSGCIDEFKCDVVMAPDMETIQAGVQRCGMLAAAAARAVGGPTASLVQQAPKVLQELAPQLPAQHVSLMAAAAAPELLQEQARQAQQRQQQEQEQDPGSSGAAGLLPQADQQPGAAAAAGLTLWRIQLCLSASAVSAVAADATTGQQQHVDPISGSALHLLVRWLVPHWQPQWVSYDPQWQHNNPYISFRDRSQADFDAALVYKVIKPSGLEQQLQQDTPGLLPKLRPYQRRAVAWMLGLEQGRHASAAVAAAAAAGATAAAAAGSTYSSSMQQLLAGLLQPYSQWCSALLLPPAVSPAQPACCSSSCSGSACSCGAAGAVGVLSLGAHGLRRVFFCPSLSQLSAEAHVQPPAAPGGMWWEHGEGCRGCTSIRVVCNPMTMGLGRTCVEALSMHLLQYDP